MDFAKKIAEIRKGLGMSQEEFGNMVHVSRQAVSKWELGQSKPDVDTLILICKTFNISSDELILSNTQEKPIEGKEHVSGNLEKIILSKRRFVLGIGMMILGVISLIMLWVDIRIGSHFFRRFWDGILDPMEFLQFIISIIIIILGLKLAYNSTKL